jgi:hypothetical protein
LQYLTFLYYSHFADVLHSRTEGSGSSKAAKHHRAQNTARSGATIEESTGTLELGLQVRSQHRSKENSRRRFSKLPGAPASMNSWPLLVHYCEECQYNTPVLYLTTVWKQVHACSHVSWPDEAIPFFVFKTDLLSPSAASARKEQTLPVQLQAQ